MKTRQLISIGAATGALIAAGPALAQPEMTYEQRQYEYAQPAPPPLPQAAPVMYRQEAVVQPIPARSYQTMPQQAPHVASYDDVEVEYEYQDAPYAQGHHQMPPQHHAQQMPPQPTFDRDAWIEECVVRYNGQYVRRDRNGNIIGGLVGAAAGGLIGNRVAGRGDRLAGSLIGAGVGGLAGLAVGSAIDSSNEKRERNEAWAYCEDYLAYYSANGSNGYMNGYAYQYGQQMMLVPVMIQVPQRAVVREYVTEETVYVPVTTYEEVPARRRAIPAPRPDKRVPVKTVPVKTVPVKTQRSVKGN